MKKRLKIVKKKMRIKRRAAKRQQELEDSCSPDDVLAAISLGPAQPAQRRVVALAKNTSATKVFKPSQVLVGTLDILSEQIGDFASWPDFPKYRIRELALGQGAEYWKQPAGGPDLNNEERATLFAFIVENGASPELAALLLINTGGMRNKAAVEHAIYLVEAHRTGALGLKYRAYVMETRQWQYVTPPLGGAERRGERSYWAEAKKALRGYLHFVVS